MNYHMKFTKCVYVFFQGFDIPDQSQNYLEFSLPDSISDNYNSTKTDPNSATVPASAKRPNSKSRLGQTRKKLKARRFNINTRSVDSGKSMRRKPKSDEFRQQRDFRRPFMYRRLKLQKMKLKTTLTNKNLQCHISCTTSLYSVVRRSKGHESEPQKKEGPKGHGSDPQKKVPKSRKSGSQKKEEARVHETAAPNKERRREPKPDSGQKQGLSNECVNTSKVSVEKGSSSQIKKGCFTETESRRKTRSSSESTCIDTSNEDTNEALQSVTALSDSSVPMDSSDETQDNRAGEIVFASLKNTASISRWWPAIVIEGKEVNKPEKAGFIWIFWFGDHRISQVMASNIVDFPSNFTQYGLCNKIVKNCPNFNKGLSEAIQICAERVARDTEDVTEEELLMWAKDGFPSDRGHFLPDHNDPLPHMVKNYLEKIKDNLKHVDTSKKKISK